MKKILSLLLICTMLLALPCITKAAADDNQVSYTLAGYGIIDADAEYDMTQPVTRGEFASMVTRLMCIHESAAEYATTSYWDVPDDHEYAGDIAVLTSIGIMNGYSETKFAPNDYVTYEQAIKVLVLITGYGEIALENGGWPDGYVTQASRNRMLGGVKLQNPFTRKDLYKLIYNTLDVPLVDRTFTTGGGKLEKTDDTLRNQIAGKTEYELYRHTGIISANSYTYTSAPYSDLYDDEVVIDNLTVGGSYVYNIGNTNAFDLVGYEVEFYARKAEWGYELLSVKPTLNNEAIEVDAEDFGVKSGNEIKYKEEKVNKDLVLSPGYKVVYNGSRVMNPTDDIFEVEDGYFTFINNDSDKSFELVMIWEYEDAIASGFTGTRINFVNDARFADLTSLAVDSENDDVKIIITDKDGKQVKSFSGERVVSVFANNDNTRYKVIVSDEIFEGSVSSMGDDGYTVGDKEYKISSTLDSIKMGVTYTMYVNYQGKLAFAKGVEETNYGYILEYSNGGFQTSVQAKIIIPGKVDAGVETNEEDVTDTSAVPYLILQNKAVEVFDFAEKVRCQGEKYSGNSLVSLLGNENMKVISYKLDSDGKICEITPLEKCGGDIAKRYQYDVYDRVFGGTTVVQTSGFAINSDTVAVCVPADDYNNINYNASEDDLNVRINITVANNNVGYRVEGYDYDPITKKAKFLMTYATMDSTAVTEIDGFSSRAAIVTASRYIYNEETGDYDLELEVLQGSAKKKLVPMKLNSSNSTIGNLKVGDLITFSLNKNDLLANAHVMQKLPDLVGRDKLETISGSVKRSLGRVGKIEYDEVDTFSRALVTKIELYTDDSGYPRVVNVKQKNTPPVYLYNTKEKTFTSVSLKEIIPESDKIFIYERNGDALIRAIVIFR